MRILVVDGQGGGIGKLLVDGVRRRFPEARITAVGTNALAANAMLKAGADQAATGENAVRVCAQDAEFILGPIGIAIADSLLGEITPNIARHIGQSSAIKLLVPINTCGNYIAGVNDKPISALVEELLDALDKM